MTTFFITGTDTGCGKTYVTRLLIHYFRSLHFRCVGLKPIASGCEWLQEQWVNEDVQILMGANQSNMSINQWLFNQPIAPHLAAQAEGITINAKDIHAFLNQSQYQTFQLRLIEGAGGLMVPLNESETWIDVVKYSQLPMIIVVAIRLGCINHTLLLNEVIHKYQLPVAGWIANKVDPQMSHVEDNIQAIQSRINIPLIATVNHHSKQIDVTRMMEKVVSLI
ncbi:dethiobiotin synthase [Legionella sp. W05-934-2]|jgi:dethiobiotin synthetase|uniref:dethiobiotin synthase n=1 Tax=Legionella sp. W05-934-2 TaxID=1198649 RepID=UPI0034631DC4